METEIIYNIFYSKIKYVHFDILPPETIFFNIALNIPISNISFYCQTNKRFNEITCDNEYFWKFKFFKDYWPVNYTVGSWKHLYESFMNVWVCGDNRAGQLGLGDFNNRNILTQIPKLKAKRISAGLRYVIMIDLDDNVYTFGNNKSGQLGLGDYQDRNIPTQIVIWPRPDDEGFDIAEPRNFKAKQVSCGAGSTALIDLENNIWVFGHNHNEQLGLGDNQDRTGPTQILNLKAKQISCTGPYTGMIDLENNIWMWGTNNMGQLGLGNNQRRNTPTKIQNIKAREVSCGDASTAIIDLNNNVWTFDKYIWTVRIRRYYR